MLSTRTQSSSLPRRLLGLPLVFAAMLGSIQPCWTQSYTREVTELLGEATDAFNAGQLDSAERSFQQAISVESNCPEAYVGLGLCAGQRGGEKNNEKALNYYKQALTLRPDYYDALFNMAQRLYSMSQYGQSLSYFLRAKDVAVPEKEADIMVCIGNVYRDKALAEQGAEQSEDMKKGLAFYQGAIEREPNLPTAHANLGQLYYAQEDWSAAERELRLACDLQEGYSYAYFLLSQVMLKQKRIAESLVAFSNSLDNETNPNYRADSQLRLRKLLQGKDKLPDDVCEHFARGFKLLAAKQFDAAEAEFEFVTSHGSAAPIRHFAWNNIGYIRGLQGKREAAIQAYKQAITAKPSGFAAPYYNLGQIYLADNKLAEAERYLTAATKQQQGQYLAHNALGIVLARKKKFNEALMQYNFALAQFGKALPVVHFNKALVLEKLGKKDEAKASFDLYLALTPRGINADAARSHLANLK